MDISINNNKYAKQADLKTLASNVDNELEVLRNYVCFFAEVLDTRVALSTCLLENEKNRLELQVVATQKIITDMIAPKQKKAIRAKLDEMESTIEKAFKAKEAEHQKDYQQEIEKLKARYNINDDLFTK